MYHHLKSQEICTFKNWPLFNLEYHKNDEILVQFNKFAKKFIHIYIYIRVKGFLLVVFSNVVGWFECGLACLSCTHPKLKTPMKI